jgi:hypothetical protein
LLAYAFRDQDALVPVTVAPDIGKARQVWIKLLAKAAKCPTSSVRIVSGQTDRTKMLLIGGNPDDLMAQISQRTGRTDI